MFRIILVLLLGSVLQACATGAKSSAMSVGVSETTLIAEDSALHNAIEVTEVTGGQETNPAWTSEVSNEAFMESLKDTLRVHTMLAAENPRYKLTAKMLSLKQPLMGFDLTVTATVRYSLTNADTEEVVFDKEIVSPYTAKMSDSFFGVKRLRLANEGSIRMNIEQLIQALVEEEKTNPALAKGVVVSSLRSMTRE